MMEEIDLVAEIKFGNLLIFHLNISLLKTNRFSRQNIEQMDQLTCQGPFNGERIHQAKGIDYEETFSHVVRHASIHLLLVVVAHLDVEFFQMDLKTLFLNILKKRSIWTKLGLAKICPTRLTEFVRPEKIGYGYNIYVRI